MWSKILNMTIAAGRKLVYRLQMAVTEKAKRRKEKKKAVNLIDEVRNVHYFLYIQLLVIYCGK